MPPRTERLTRSREGREEEMLTVMNGLHAEARGRREEGKEGDATSFAASRSSRETLLPPRTERLTRRREGREEEMLTVMNGLTRRARRTRLEAGELPREAARDIREYQIPRSTTPGVPRWCDRPRVQPPAGNCPVRGAVPGAGLGDSSVCASSHSRSILVEPVTPSGQREEQRHGIG